MLKRTDMIVLLVFASLLITSQIPNREIDPVLEPYYTEFKRVVKETCPTKDVIRDPGILTITFVEENTLNFLPDSVLNFFEMGNNIGLCSVFLNTARIKIDKQYWNHSNFDDRYELITHELTHCLLGHWYLAKYPLHTSDPGHYMYPSMRTLFKYETESQLITVVKDMCE